MIARFVAMALIAATAFLRAPSASPTGVSARPLCKLCLYGPDNMAFDARGNMYLVDTDHAMHSRVLKLSPDGKLLADWRVFAAVPGQDNGPAGIALDSHGDILVTDPEAVLKLSPSGKLMATIGEDAGARDPQGHVALDRQGDIYFAQAQRNLVRKFSPDGKLLASWHRAKGSGIDQWNHPEQLSAAPDGNLVVQDFGNHRMIILSTSGRTISTFDATPGVPLARASTSSSCVDRHGHIFVADYQFDRIQEFDSKGRLLATIGNTPGNLLFEQAPNSLAIDHAGYLYATDGLSIVKFARTGKLLARWR